MKKSQIFFHGTNVNFEEFKGENGIYFTSCPNEASDFATGEVWGKDAIILEGSRVIPVKLNFKNPIVISDETLYEEIVMDGVDIALYKSKGYDSLIYDTKDGSSIYCVAFDNSQIINLFEINYIVQ